MKLFHKGTDPPKEVPPLAPEPVFPTPPPIPPAPKLISLNAEQMGILEKSIDPRVERIMQGIYAERAAAELALNAHRVIDPLHFKSAKRQVVQNQDGLWQIVPSPIEDQPISLLDTL